MVSWRGLAGMHANSVQGTLIALWSLQHSALVACSLPCNSLAAALFLGACVGVCVGVGVCVRARACELVSTSAYM